MDANNLKEEGRLIGMAAKQLLHKSTTGVAESAQRMGIAFQTSSASTKLSIVGGVSTGITFALTGLRTMNNALKKDKETGKRDYASAALGAAEFLGGGFVAALFWERLKVSGGITGKEDTGQSR